MHKDNITPLKPLPQDKIVHYNNLFKNESYQELIPQVEQSFSKAPFWLDAHRLVALSLEALDMNESASQVKEHLAMFLRQYPELVDFKFSDKSGFADEITRQWIYSEIFASASSQSIELSSIELNDDFDNVINDAQELVKKQKLKDAIKLFQNKIITQSNLRNKIYWKYYLAQFCFDNDQYKLAFYLLKDINGFLLENNLEYWEPDLEKNIVYLLILLYKKPFNNSSNDFCFLREVIEDDTEESMNSKNRILSNHDITQLYTRLCHLDPILAIDV